MELTRRRARPRRAFRLWAPPLVALLVASSTLWVATVLAAAKVKVWIDQPLPGAVLALAPAPVTVHAAADAGVFSVRFLVDGLPADQLASPAGDLVTVEWTWVPPGIGQHLLTVIALASDGSSSDPVSVGVTFVDAEDVARTPPPSESIAPTATTPGATAPPGATTTPTEPATPKPAATPRVTLQPTRPPQTPHPTPPPTPQVTPACTPEPPTLSYPDSDAELQEPTPTLEWLYLEIPIDCLPSGFRIQISTARDFSAIVMTGQAPSTQWYWTTDPGLATCVDYYWRVRALAEDGHAGPPSDVRWFHLAGRTAC